MLFASTWLQRIHKSQLKEMLLLSTIGGYNGAGKMRQRKPYHQDNLREALLKAAIRLIAEVGPAAFTLREVLTCSVSERCFTRWPRAGRPSREPLRR
jgi:hypothetical protein